MTTATMTTATIRTVHMAAASDTFEAPPASNSMPSFEKRLRKALEGEGQSGVIDDHVRRATVVPNIAYSSGGHPKQKLDVYLPESVSWIASGDAVTSKTPGAALLPVVIHVHGGGHDQAPLSQ